MKLAANLLLYLLMAFILLGCKKTSIEMLCVKDEQTRIKEIYLINNHPKNSSKLTHLIKEFNSDMYAYPGNVKRIFLKENSSRTIIGTKDNIDYSESKCTEIDPMDIIYEVNKFQLPSQKDTIIFDDYSKY